VGTEFRETGIRITSDPRLRPGLRAALEHICQRNGFTKQEQRDLVAKVEAECMEAFEERKAADCVITIDELEDKIEVSIRSAREVHAPEQNSSARSAQHAGRSDQMHETLVRHFHKNPAHS
jgi:hypothetical protein